MIDMKNMSAEDFLELVDALYAEPYYDADTTMPSMHKEPCQKALGKAFLLAKKVYEQFKDDETDVFSVNKNK